MNSDNTATKDEGMTQKFNLVGGEGGLAWVPVLRTDGTTGFVTLDEAFAEAESIREVVHSDPMLATVLERTMLAIIYRATGGASGLDQWESWDWEHLSKEARRYLREHRDLFWLIHDEHPFGQSLDMEKIARDIWSGKKAKKPKPADDEDEDGDGGVVTVGSTQLHTQRIKNSALGPYSSHSTTSLDWMPDLPEMAARLIYVQSTGVGGVHPYPADEKGKTRPSVGLIVARRGTTILRGSTLADTLRRNFIPVGGIPFPAITGPDDLPFWERDMSPTVKSKIAEAGPVGVVTTLAPASRSVGVVWTDDRPEAVFMVGAPTTERVPRVADIDLVRGTDPWTPWSLPKRTGTQTDEDYAAKTLGSLSDAVAGSPRWLGLRAVVLGNGVGFESVLAQWSATSDEDSDTVPLELVSLSMGDQASIPGTPTRDRFDIPAEATRDPGVMSAILEAYDYASSGLNSAKGYIDKANTILRRPKGFGHEFVLDATDQIAGQFRACLPHMTSLERVRSFRSRWGLFVARTIVAQVVRRYEATVTPQDAFRDRKPTRGSGSTKSLAQLSDMLVAGLYKNLEVKK